MILLIVATLLSFQTVMADPLVEAYEAAQAASNELGIPVVALKVDDEDASLSGELSILVGLPNLPGLRYEVKALKGTFGAGVDIGTAVGMSGNLGLVANVAPLAAVGFNNIYGGYRLYGIKNFADGEANTIRLNSFFGGFRIKGFFVEAGKSPFVKHLKDGSTITEKSEWIGQFGFVVDTSVFKKRK